MVDDGKHIGELVRERASVIDLFQLRYAISAADHGSFRRAAAALRLRQSTLSRCIRRLEETVEMTVFERSSGGVRTTPGGRNFLRVARSILEQVDALVATAHSSGHGRSGRLVIGFYTSLSAGNLRATVVEYVRRFPLLELDLIEGSRTRLTTALRNGVLDLAIITAGAPLVDCATMPLWSERVLVVLPERHRLAAGEASYWTDLKSETLLLGRQDPGPELQSILLAKLASARDRPKIVQYHVSRGSLRSLVGAGLGVSLTTEASAGVSSGVVYREVRDGAGPAWVDYCAFWRAGNGNPALTSFLALLAERYPLPTTRS